MPADNSPSKRRPGRYFEIPASDAADDEEVDDEGTDADQGSYADEADDEEAGSADEEGDDEDLGDEEMEDEGTDADLDALMDPATIRDLDAIIAQRAGLPPPPVTSSDDDDDYYDDNDDTDEMQTDEPVELPPAALTSGPSNNLLAQGADVFVETAAFVDFGLSVSVETYQPEDDPATAEGSPPPVPLPEGSPPVEVMEVLDQDSTNAPMAQSDLSSANAPMAQSDQSSLMNNSVTGSRNGSLSHSDILEQSKFGEQQ